MTELRASPRTEEEEEAVRNSKTAGEAVTGASPKKTSRAAAPAGTRKPAARSANSRPAGRKAARPAIGEVRQMPDQETIERMVAEAAYYLAEKRAFAPGFEAQDWQAAREQIEAQLRNAKNPLG